MNREYPGLCISGIYRRFLRIHHVLWHQQGNISKVAEIRFFLGNSNRKYRQTAQLDGLIQIILTDIVVGY